MKKLITLLSAVLITASIWAQSPQKMSYQAVIRNASNTLVTNTAVGMQISILQTTSTGTAVYVETQTPTTNANGLVSIEIGGGTVVSGTFSTIDWSAGPYFIKTETDPAGGTTYTITGTSQLLSVPYSLHAKNTESANNGLTIDGNTAIDNGAGWHRSYGATGWYNQTYGGGIYMKNSTWVEVYSKSFLVPSGTFQVGGIGNSTFKIASGVMTYTDGNQGLNKVLTSDANGVATWQTKANPTGLEVITEGSFSGRRLIGQSPANYGNIGYLAVDLSNSTSSSTTKGATNNHALATGFSTTASGIATTAMGQFTKAESYSSTAIGAYNIGGGNATTWVATDPLFEIGNGTSSTPSNAFTVYKNGNTDVSGVFRAQNNIWPTTGAGVEIAYDPLFVAAVLPSFKFGAGYIQSYSRDLSEFRPLFLGARNVLPVNDNSTGLGNSTYRWLQVFAVNGTIQTSDRRLKKDINNLNYGLNTVLKLRPVSYKWKKGNQDLNLGLIAQEVQKIIPEVIDVGTDKDKTLGMKYTALIPVIIKATQEQQKIIEKQQKEINELKILVNKLLHKKILVSNN